MVFGLCRGLNAKVHVWVHDGTAWSCPLHFGRGKDGARLLVDAGEVWKHCGVVLMILPSHYLLH